MKFSLKYENLLLYNYLFKCYSVNCYSKKDKNMNSLINYQMSLFDDFNQFLFSYIQFILCLTLIP